MSITYKPLSNKVFGGLESLFNTSRECGLCWCMNHRFPPENEVQGEAARKGMQHLIDSGKVWGILAYDGETCVGWAAVDPVLNQPGHDYSFWKHADKAADTWSIHCLYIHPEHRGKGLSDGLIKECIEIAKANSAKKVIAFPIPKEMRKNFPEHDSEFSGRMSSYQKNGFTSQHRINDFYEVMALEL